MAPDAYDGCPDHPYFPGDIPAESFFLWFDFLGTLILTIALLCWIVARFRPAFLKASRVLATIAAMFIGLGLLCLVPFLLRRTGEWPALQHAIQEREAALRVFHHAHPSWTNKQVALEFRKQTKLPWEFHFKDPELRPVHFKVSDWRDRVPRIVVGYNDCNNTMFDPDSMWVESSD